jgi:mannitol/fructose-specific phosphotransferase system IIA component (Ntr-type)
VLNRLLRREKEASTGIGNGLAIPHATVDGLAETVVSLATLRVPMEFRAVDGEKVSVVFLVVGRESSRGERLKVLARVAQLGASPDFVRSLGRARSRGELIERVRHAESRVR